MPYPRTQHADPNGDRINNLLFMNPALDHWTFFIVHCMKKQTNKQTKTKTKLSQKIYFTFQVPNFGDGMIIDQSGFID